MIKKSNAKINFGLKIKGRKENLHLIESVFVPVDLYDELEFSESDEIKITGIDEIPEEENIVYKAVVLMKERYGIPGVSVRITKRIPIGSGLGGGSSNAAVTIKALNEMFSLRLSYGELSVIGRELGSDVPFFLVNKPSFVSGCGETIKTIPDFPKLKGIIVFDDLRMSTAEVYRRYDEKKNKNKNEKNDLEAALAGTEAGRKIKEIERTLSALGASETMMSGAGGAVFGIFEHDTEKAFRVLEKKYRFVRIFESI